MTFFSFHLWNESVCTNTDPLVGLEPRKNKEYKLTHFGGQKLTPD